MLSIITLVCFAAFIIWIACNGAYILQHVPMAMIFAGGTVSCWAFVIAFCILMWMLFGKKGE